MDADEDAVVGDGRLLDLPELEDLGWAVSLVAEGLHRVSLVHSHGDC